MKKLIVIIIFFVINSLFAQSRDYVVNWKINSKKIKQSKPGEIYLFQSKNYVYNVDNIYFSELWKVHSMIDGSSVKLTDVKYSKLNRGVVNSLDLNDIDESFKATLTSNFGRNQIYALLRINAIIYKNNQYYKLDSFSVSYRYLANKTTSLPQNIYDSKWATGKWYRFEIEQTGVHKIDKGFLESLGINLNNIDPRTIKIYGNGGQSAPLSNNISYPEDIAEIAIDVVGEQDGKFDNNDYILFYGQSHKGWNEDNQSNLNP